MRIRKAVITVAGPGQRTLPLQVVVDQDGAAKPVLRILIEECLGARVEEIGLVIHSGDEAAYRQAAGDYAGLLSFIAQTDPPRGYGHAIACARDFAAAEAFLHLVGDHLYIRRRGAGSDQRSCAEQLVAAAEAEACSVSAVQATREGLLPYFGAVGVQRHAGRNDLSRITTVIEKPTPTEAEQRLVVPGLRSGHYLCFFGMHVLTPAIFELLETLLAETPEEGAVTLSAALDQLARKEQYLALEQAGRRYDLGSRYGLLYAQLALALAGRDREQVLGHLVELAAAQ
jgi:UTP--glucose-1-phosphate uridylyltransferase